jgi:hypothetical protein
MARNCHSIRPQTKVALSCVRQYNDSLAGSDGGDRYTGPDRFGRIADQNWMNPTTVASTDRFQYGYDEAGNVLYKKNLSCSTFSELYHNNSSASGDDEPESGTGPINAIMRSNRFRPGTGGQTTRPDARSPGRATSVHAVDFLPLLTGGVESPPRALLTAWAECEAWGGSHSRLREVRR